MRVTYFAEFAYHGGRKTGCCGMPKRAVHTRTLCGQQVMQGRYATEGHSSPAVDGVVAESFSLRVCDFPRLPISQLIHHQVVTMCGREPERSRDT
jgi:hypothetical protein